MPKNLSNSWRKNNPHMWWCKSSTLKIRLGLDDRRGVTFYSLMLSLATAVTHPGAHSHSSRNRTSVQNHKSSAFSIFSSSLLLAAKIIAMTVKRKLSITCDPVTCATWDIHGFTEQQQGLHGYLQGSRQKTALNGVSHLRKTIHSFLTQYPRRYCSGHGQDLEKYFSGPTEYSKKSNVADR